MSKYLRALALTVGICLATRALAQEIPIHSSTNRADSPTQGTQENTTETNTAEASATPPEESVENTHEAPVLTDAMLERQLREVSTHLDTLKEDTFTTKSRLLLLREEVLQRSVNGAHLVIRHKNNMGGQYQLVKMYYAIDRIPIFSKNDPSGDLDRIQDEILYDHLVAPGAHQLSVMYVYTGKTWGVFNYMKDYTFRVESGYDFIIDEGKTAELLVTANERGNFFTPYEERPAIDFSYEQAELIPTSARENAADAPSESTP